MKYIIEIGEIFDTLTGQKEARQKIEISQEQFNIIELFANIKKNEDLETFYVINDCRFKMYPRIFCSESQAGEMINQ